MLAVTGCCTLPEHKDIDQSATTPPEYTFNPIPVFVYPGVPETYIEAIDALVVYDGYVEELLIWIEGVLEILYSSGVVIHIPEPPTPEE